MFDTFFNDHKPVSEELTAADSAAAERINGLLKSRMAEISPNETKPKKRKTLKRVLWVAAAAVVTAAALGVTAAANFTGGSGYIVRANNKRIASETYTYSEGNIKADIVVYEMPCELLIDKEGKPVTEDSNIDRRFAAINMEIYEQYGEGKVGMTFSGMTFGSMYGGKAVKLPVPNGQGIYNSAGGEQNIEVEYDEKQTKEFWKKYWENPEEEARKWSEFFEGYFEYAPEDDRTMCEMLKDRVGVILDDAISADRATEEDKEKVFEFIDENFADEIGE